MRPEVLIAAVILTAGIAVRLPFVLIPPAPNGLYTVDELALALSVVDRWLGLPPINLCWPGLPLQLLTFIGFAPEFLWSIATDRSLVGLSDTIVRHYDNPSSLILTMRLISSIVVPLPRNASAKLPSNRGNAAQSLKIGITRQIADLSAVASIA